MSLANDYFLLYHGITFEQNLDVEPIDTEIDHDIFTIYSLILSTTRKECDKFIPLTSFKTFCQRLNVKSPSNLSELNHLQHNIVENIIENKSIEFINTLHESFAYLKEQDLLGKDDFDKLSSLFDPKELDLTQTVTKDEEKEKTNKSSQAFWRTH